MPKRAKPGPAGTQPIQLLLSFDQATLTRVRPERNEWRYYRLAVWPDLFGRALLARHWGRFGLDPHPDASAALNALGRLAHAKCRCGYRDRTTDPAAPLPCPPAQAEGEGEVAAIAHPPGRRGGIRPPMPPDAPVRWILPGD